MSLPDRIMFTAFIVYLMFKVHWLQDDVDKKQDKEP